MDDEASGVAGGATDHADRLAPQALSVGAQRLSPAPRRRDRRGGTRRTAKSLLDVGFVVAVVKRVVVNAVVGWFALGVGWARAAGPRAFIPCASSIAETFGCLPSPLSGLRQTSYPLKQRCWGGTVNV